MLGTDGEAKRTEPNSDQAVAAARQVLKRRRLLGKQPPPGATSVPSSSLTSDSNAQPTWGGVFQHLNVKVPVKKRIGFNEGDHEVTLAQQLTPDFAVKHIVCQGTNRVQPPHASCDVRDISLRYTMVVKRADGEIAVDGGIEEWTKTPWTKIPKYKQGRKGIPAKVSLTALGAPWTPATRSDSGNARGAIGGVDVPADPIGRSGRVGVGVSPKKYPQAWPGVYGFK